MLYGAVVSLTERLHLPGNHHPYLCDCGMLVEAPSQQLSYTIDGCGRMRSLLSWVHYNQQSVRRPARTSLWANTVLVLVFQTLRLPTNPGDIHVVLDHRQLVPCPQHITVLHHSPQPGLRFGASLEACFSSIARPWTNWRSRPCAAE